jgi:hypothetical protein
MGIDDADDVVGACASHREFVHVCLARDNNAGGFEL